ncbi:vWA domain-containing protein [Ktedonobacter robiniae]|uniref:VWA domain-containing protein n=1 Tax=Ktedonobacter robiniae TaxID=2778365 RepID=A0ABQ3ULF8_9CHLR|nr:vWA domain-containing protein [Ktedonobacter robiniae]GHO53492.1 VWA domain-containing protein [Ktedonobacter robiniae]
MFSLRAYQNPYLQVGQNTIQAVISLHVDDNAQFTPAPLSLALAIDQSASMHGAKMQAAREGAIQVVQALDETMQFMLVSFNDVSRLLFGPAMGTSANKRSAIAAIQRITATNGTRMSTALNMIAEHLGRDQSRARKILFLTDGRNEGETRFRLNEAVERCRVANISISAWGVGTDWDASELRHMADSTHGSADIIPQPQQIIPAFTLAFNEMRRTAITHATLDLWSPVGVKITRIQQVYPSLAECQLEGDGANPRQMHASLGSLSMGEQRDYLLNLEIPVHDPGQPFLMVRPSVRYLVGGGTEQVQKSTQDGWVFVEWTEDLNLAAQVEEHIAHYTHEEELSDAIKQGQAALVAGDVVRATKLLGEALLMSEQSGNEKITHLLSNLVLRDDKGTIRLNPHVDAVARKTLAINTGRTSKLK